MFKESMKEFAQLETDPRDIIRLFPSISSTSMIKPSTTPQPLSVANLKLEDRDLENGLLALIDYLTDVRYNLNTMPDGKSKPFGENLSKLLSIIDTTLLKCYLQV